MRLRLSMLEFLVLTILWALVFALMGTLYRTAEYSDILSLTRSDDGKWCAAVYQSGRIQLWDTSGDVPRAVPCDVRTTPPFAYGSIDTEVVQWLDDGTMATARDLSYNHVQVVLHDPGANRRKGAFRYQRGAFPQHAKISPDGQWIGDFSGASPPLVRPITHNDNGWSVGPPIPLSESEAVATFARGMSFTRDGHVFVFGENGGDSGNATGYPDVPDGPFIEKYSLIGQHVATWSIPEAQEIVGIDADRLQAVLFDYEFGTAQVAIYDLSTETFLPLETAKLWSSERIALSGCDGTLGLVSQSDDVELWDMETGTRVASSVETVYANRLIVAHRNLALTSDGSNVIAWIRDRNRLVPRTLISPSSGIGPFGLIAGFIGWGIGWGFLQRRRIARESAKDPRLQEGSLYSPLTVPDTQSRPVTIVLFAIVLMFLLLFVLWLMAILASLSWAGTVVIVLFLSFGLVGVLYVAVRLGGGLWNRELRRVAQVASGPINTSQWGYLETCFVGQSQVPPLLALEKEQAAAWEAWIGRPAPEPESLLFVGFERGDDYVRYLKRDVSAPGLFSPGVRRGRMIFCEEFCDRFLVSRDAVLRALMTLFHTQLHYARVFRPALQGMLNYRLSHPDYAPRRVACAVRRFRASWSKGNPPSLDEFFALTREDFVAMASLRHHREIHRRQVNHLDVAATITELLTGPHATAADREAFARMYQDPPVVSSKENFCRHFGRSVHELTRQWHAWILSQDVRSHPPLESQLAKYVNDVTIGTVMDSGTPMALREVSVRALGEVGATEAIEPLLQLAESLAERKQDKSAAESDTGAPESLVDDIVWSLESITGTNLGVDPAAWRDEIETGMASGSVEQQFALHTSGLDAADSTRVGTSGLTSMSTSISTSSPETEAIYRRSSQEKVLRARRIVWALMFVSGLWGICFGITVSFAAADFPNWTNPWTFGLWGIWYPPRLIGIVTSSFALALPMSRSISGARPIALCQLFTLLTCDVISATFGLATLVTAPRALPRRANLADWYASSAESIGTFRT